MTDALETPVTPPAQTIDDLCINTIRTLTMDAVQAAGNGHPGAPMGMAAMGYVLWTRHLRHNPRNPEWPDRDRFVLSAGHASMLLYSLLHLTGYDLPLDEIKHLRQWSSRTPGHPERGLTPGVEVTTGPLGQGFAMGVGMAIAERFLAARLNRPGHDVIDHYTYAIVSDGDLMEGVAAEAASLAGNLGLGRLIYLYDDNNITIDGASDLSFNEDVAARFEAYGWHVQRIDGSDPAAIDGAIAAAKQETGRPSLIAARTTIGHGSPNKGGKSSAHGSALGADEVALTKEALGWPTDEPFHVPGEVREAFQATVARGAALEADWRARFDAIVEAEPGYERLWQAAMSAVPPEGWEASLPTFAPGEKLATREASGKVLNAIAEAVPNILGGSADLAGSNNTYLTGLGDIDREHWEARNLHFGVREHAMGSAANGMALHGGIHPYTGTFLVFSDYMRPAVRLAAIQEAHTTFIFTHDSIGVGEDGPTHQPIEHLASLRAMPGLKVMRPADANETAACWRVALNGHGPSALILSRQKLPVLDIGDRPAAGVPRGAYVAADSPTGKDDALLIATGSEVALAIEAQQLLDDWGFGVRVVSMPCWSLFAEQPKEYRDAVLPPGIRARVAVEAAATFGWERWVGESGAVVGLDHFGASAPGDRVMTEMGFTAAKVAAAVEACLTNLRGKR